MCNHIIGMEWEYERGCLVDCKDLFISLKQLVDSDYQEYVKTLDKRLFDFNKKNYFDFKDMLWYEFEFFDYCPNCGTKIDKQQIRQEINNKMVEYVKGLDRCKKQLQTQKKIEQIESKESKPTDLQQNGYVYLVKMGETYKIGISINPENRLKEFTKLPYPLEYICVEKVYNYGKVEQQLHSVFAGKNIRGEWFLLDDTDVSFIVDYIKQRKVKE